MKKAIIAAILLLAGCMQRTSYVEGTSFQLGLWLPVDGNLYGLDVISYVSGARVSAPSNACVEIRRKFSATNEYAWGMASTAETTDTEIRIKVENAEEKTAP